MAESPPLFYDPDYLPGLTLLKPFAWRGSQDWSRVPRELVQVVAAPR